MNVRQWASCGLIAAFVTLSGPAWAQQQPPPGNAKSAPPAAEKQAPPKGGWTVQCANQGAGLNCKAVQTIILEKTRQMLLSISVSRADDGKGYALLLQLPHGIFIPADIAMAVDAAAGETLKVQTCDARGCYAGAPLAADKIAAFTEGEKLTVTFQDLKKQKIVVPVPLKGFDEAVKKL